MSDRGQIDEIKQKLDIVQVGQKYLRDMKRSGPNYFALCPFHNEKTPSFSINQDLQIFKCFGCGESGDVISFIQKIEGVDFPKALEMAADMAGVVLRNDFQPSPRNEKLNVEKQKLLEANKLAMQYYNYVLLKHDKGKEARDYCNRRKITKKVIKGFEIGYAPEGYSNLKNFLIKKGFDQKDLVNWGLLVNKRGKTYDKFRDRLMFPIFDNNGDVVGFSGRQLKKTDYGPKYLNSPETLVYKKKETLYGLFQAKNDIRKRNFAILVEGNVDILSSHRVGIENIVCPLGTALTVEQCKLLKRYADTVYFALDTDEAGERALIRGLQITQEVGLEVFVLDIEDFQDSDELIMKDPEKWKKVVSNPKDVLDYLITKFEGQFDTSTAKGKISFLDKIAPFVNEIRDDIVKQAYCHKIAAIAGVEEGQVQERLAKTKPLSAKTKQSKEDARNFIAQKRLSREEYLYSVFLQFRENITLQNEMKKFFEDWILTVFGKLKDGVDISDISMELEENQIDSVKRYLTNLLTGVDSQNAGNVVLSTIRLIEREKVDAKIKKLRLDIRKAEAKGEDSSSLMKELSKLTKLKKQNLA